MWALDLQFTVNADKYQTIAVYLVDELSALALSLLKAFKKQKGNAVSL
ncbi:MAG: hypothetical protein ACRCYF_08600 [Shewanella sp.]